MSDSFFKKHYLPPNYTMAGFDISTFKIQCRRYRPTPPWFILRKIVSPNELEIFVNILILA
jgi:hypothetical protein